MLQPGQSGPSHVWRASAPVLGCALAGGLASAAFADGGLRWQLSANVPVMCAIIAISAPPDTDARLAITTTCNAERFQLMLADIDGPAAVHAARSSAGPVAISAGAVTITSARPGGAITLIDLARPFNAGQLSVTLQPI